MNGTDILRIRIANITDADALASCIDAAYAQYANRISDLPAVSEGCADDIVNNQVWVAVIGAKIIGGLVLVRRNKAIKLANVAIHPDYSGQGLGQKLVALAEYKAKEQGFSEISLNTHALMPENVQFYRRLGWEETSKKGNTVSMRKRLVR